MIPVSSGVHFHGEDIPEQGGNLGNAIKGIEGNIGVVFSQLAEVNCKLWHEQEKVYEFDKVPVEQKDGVVKHLALLNLERNQCMDQIDKKLCAFVESFHSKE